MLFVRREHQWLRLNGPPPRRWYILLFNPAWGFFHAVNNLLERLVLEISEGKDVNQLVSYQLLKDFIRREMTEQSREFAFEFKVTVDGEDVLVGTVERHP